MPEQAHNGTLESSGWIRNRPSCFTPAQTLQYLSFIELDLGISEDVISNRSISTSFEQLTQAQPPRSSLGEHIYALVRFWQTVVNRVFLTKSLDSSASHSMDVSPQATFERAVVQKMGGSYCFGLNNLLLNVLLALGYRAYTGAARVKEGLFPADQPPWYTILSHEVIFVQPDQQSNSTYLVDIGFGSTGLVRPILLSNQSGNEVHGINAFEIHRLTRTSFLLSSVETRGNSSHEVKWNLEVLRQKAGEGSNGSRWRTLYTFSEEEFYPNDFEAASFVISRMPNPQGLFWCNLVAVKVFVLEDDGRLDRQLIGHRRAPTTGSGTAMGRMILIGRELKCNTGGNTEVVKTLGTEAERISTLREVFGVILDDSDSQFIVGRAAAISEA